ncbi:MAG: methylmalonyl Co-A mutase-associated GTPase MeaB, partial [Myxococcota bacterium]
MSASPARRPGPSPESLAAGLRRKERRAVAQALNLVEDARPAARARIAELLRLVREDVAEAGHVVGVTGPPGVGKSTLSAALARTLRRRGQRVGVVAVDPSSLASGGSLLGDRARMGEGAPDPGLFIRSLATGGHAGGL